MPTSSPTIFIAACMTFLQCVKPVIFTCSNTLFILITSSLIFSLSPYFRFPSVLPKSLSSNASLNLKSLSLLESLKSFSIILMGSSFALSPWSMSFSSLISAVLLLSYTVLSFTLFLPSFSIFLLVIFISIFVTQPLDVSFLFGSLDFFHQFPTFPSLSTNHALFPRFLFWPLFPLSFIKIPIHSCIHFSPTFS